MNFAGPTQYLMALNGSFPMFQHAFRKMRSMNGWQWEGSYLIHLLDGAPMGLAERCRMTRQHAIYPFSAANAGFLEAIPR